MSEGPGFVLELGVSNVDASIKFYCEILGCSVGEIVKDDNGSTVWAELKYGHSTAMLQRRDLLAAELPGVISEISANRAVIVLRVGDKSDAKSLHRHLLQVGRNINSGPVETEYGSFEFSILDPDDYVVLVAGKG